MKESGETIVDKTQASTESASHIAPKGIWQWINPWWGLKKSVGYNSQVTRESLDRLRSTFGQIGRLFSRRTRLAAENTEQMRQYDWRQLTGDNFRIFAKTYWGVDLNDADERYRVIRGLGIESGLYFLMAMAIIWSLMLYPNTKYLWLSTLVAAPAFVLNTLTRLWRLWCLSEQRFVPFWRWIIFRTS